MLPNLLLTFAESSSENRRRIFYVLFILVIIAVALLVFIGWVFVTITKIRGKEFDSYAYDPVATGVIKSDREFNKYAHKKNKLIFFKESLPAMLIILGGFLTYIIYMAATENWTYNPWGMDEGFGSLLFTWDFSKIIQFNVNGTIGMLINWPELTHSPTFIIENWPGYISVTCWLVGGAWYFWATLGLLGRYLRLLRLKRKIYEKSLEGFNLFEDQLKAVKAAEQAELMAQAQTAK